MYAPVEICHAATSNLFKTTPEKDLESPNRQTLEDTQRELLLQQKKIQSPLPSLGLGGGSGLSFLTLVLRSRSGLLLGLVLFGTRAAFSFVAIGRSPQGQVVTQKLHDEGAVTVALFGQGVKLSNSVIERLLGKVASTVRRVQDLIVENGEVKGETKADGVGGGQVGLSNIGSVLNAVSIARQEHASWKKIPCRPREQQWQQPCACCQMRTQRDNGGSHPSCSPHMINNGS